MNRLCMFWLCTYIYMYAHVYVYIYIYIYICIRNVYMYIGTYVCVCECWDIRYEIGAYPLRFQGHGCFRSFSVLDPGQHWPIELGCSNSNINTPGSVSNLFFVFSASVFVGGFLKKKNQPKKEHEVVKTKSYQPKISCFFLETSYHLALFSNHQIRIARATPPGCDR